MSSEVMAYCAGCGARTQHLVEGGAPQCAMCGAIATRHAQATAQSVGRRCPRCQQLTLHQLTAGHWACRPCGYSGSSGEEQSLASEIRECFLEDTRRGIKGEGGGSSGGARKKVVPPLRRDAASQRIEDEWASSRTRRVAAEGPANRVLRITGLDASADEVREALAEFFSPED